MKVIKPLRLGILTRVFEHGREPHFVVTVFACFPFDEPRALYTEQALWKAMTEELGMGAALDTGMPKPRGEFLVDGHAYTPKGEPRIGIGVEVQVGALKKSLMVAGDRRWELLGMTMPSPFTSMPVDWAHAYGGDGFAQNPLGRGHVPLIGADGKKYHPLPNVELADQRVKSKGDKPSPASFRALDYTWPQRFKKLGTYDKTWQDKEYPGFARDLDLEAFNTACEDQRIDGYFVGDETFSAVNMHPTEERIEGRLPSLVARVFATVSDGGTEELREIKTRLDTVHLFPHRKLGIVTFRGQIRINEDDAHDVKHLVLAAERLGDEPRGIEHYRQVLADRLDKQKGALLALRDKDLLPDLAPFDKADPFLEEMTDKLAREHLMEENSHRRALRAHEERHAQIVALGLDPAELLGPPPQPIPLTKADPNNLVEVFEASEKKAKEDEETLERDRKSAEAQARELCSKNGMDYDELMKKSLEEGGGPPTFSADAELAKVRAAAADARQNGIAMPGIEAMATDPLFESRLRDNERSLKELYRRYVHVMPPVQDADAPLARTRGEIFLQAVEEGSVSERDFSGAVLKNADLAGKNLKFAYLEKADLEGANLEGADLEGAVLARANLRGANLKGARLSSSNFGHADLTGANLSETELSQATLDHAMLDKTRFEKARLFCTTFDETVLRGANLEGTTIEKCIFRSVRFEGVNLERSKLESTVLIECDLAGSSFNEATFSRAAFFQVCGDKASFRGATADNIRFVHECSLRDAVFAGASLKSSNFRDTDLRGASFDDANLEGADLSGANLEGATLQRANLREARLIRTNLTRAQLGAANLLGSIMQKARVDGATFKGANLFRADLAYVVGDDKTTFSEAYIDQVRTIRRLPP